MERGDMTVTCHTRSLLQNEIKIYMLALSSNLLSVLIIMTISRILNKKIFFKKKQKTSETQTCKTEKKEIQNKLCITKRY